MKQRLNFVIFVIIGLLLQIVDGGGYCYIHPGSKPGRCRKEGKYLTEDMETCCSDEYATGFVDPMTSILFPDHFENHEDQVQCKSCADILFKGENWCFVSEYQRTERGGAICINDHPNIKVSDQQDCCLWLNSTSFTNSPYWLMSNVSKKWTTPCKPCDKSRFLVCYREIHENALQKRTCGKAHSRLALNPSNCCDRTDAAGYSWIDVGPWRGECHPCPINGGWSLWSAWSPCSATCGSGVRRRARKCDNPVSRYGGSQCRGMSEHVDKCDNPYRCSTVPVISSEKSTFHGVWSQWSAMSPCSVTCGQGIAIRRRICLPSSDEQSDFQCAGSEIDVQPCQRSSCLPATQVDAVKWIWSSWSSCHVTCGIGLKSRQRLCLPGNVTNSGDAESDCNIPDGSSDVTICELPPCSNTHQQTSGEHVSYWVVALIICFGVILGVGIFVFLKRHRLRERFCNMCNRMRTSPRSGRNKRENLPPIPSSLPSITAASRSQNCVSNDYSNSRNVGGRQDADGYEIPRCKRTKYDPRLTLSELNGKKGDQGSDKQVQIDGSDRPCNDHIYEQVDFSSSGTKSDMK